MELTPLWQHRRAGRIRGFAAPKKSEAAIHPLVCKFVINGFLGNGCGSDHGGDTRSTTAERTREPESRLLSLETRDRVS